MIDSLLETSKITPEWEDFYIEGREITKILQPMKTKNQIVTSTASDLRLSMSWGISLLSSQVGEESILTQSDTFSKRIIKELTKVSFFYTENIEYYVKRLTKFKEQLTFIDKNDLTEKKMIKAYDQLELGLKEMYKELNLLRNFINSNFNIETILLNKYIKYTKGLIKEEDVNLILTKIKLHSLDTLVSQDAVGKISIEAEKLFSRYYYRKYTDDSDKILFKYISNPHSISSDWEVFFFGIYIGFIIMIILLIFIISSHFNIDTDTDFEYFLLFPIFRGVLLICTYIWLWGLNVYYWNKNGINFKLVLQFDEHYSELPTILQRAAGLTTIVLLSLLYYLLIRTKTAETLEFLNIIPIKFTPLIGWVVFFVYLFFPSQNYCNYKGRMWFFRMIWYSIKLKEFIPCMWFMSQFSSFAGGLRDLAYTFCYYYHYNHTPHEISKACDERGFGILFFSLIPFFIRMVHSAKLAYYQGHFYPQFIITLRYFFSILATFMLSVMLMVDLYYLLYWFIAVLWSALLSFYFDLKLDWGFLDKTSKNYPLREKLCFKDKGFYFFCMVFNLIGRFVWVIIINPQIIYKFMRPQFVLTIFFFAELVRKAIWNFIYVENKHIAACSTFRATRFVPFPFWKEEDGRFLLKNETKEVIDKIKERINKIKESLFMYEEKGKEEFVQRIKSICKDNMRDYIF